MNGTFAENIGRNKERLKKVRIRTRLFELTRFYSMGELATMLGLSVSYLYRVREGNRQINQKFIVATLTTFPKRKFEDLFYIERRE